MYTKTLNNKLIFIGDLKSINLEIISNSCNYLFKNNYKIILLGDIIKIREYFDKIKFKIKISELFHINDHFNYANDSIFIFDIGDSTIAKSRLILNQIKISNNLSKFYSYDLITMPIDKSIIKRNNQFNGVTEYLSKINKKKTYMLMRGNKFSIIPLTTHIRFRNILDRFNKRVFYHDLINILTIIIKKKFKYTEIIILGINPHAGEDGTLGNEEVIMKKVINIINQKIKLIKLIGPLSADSAFNDTKPNQLFISYYHDQALIPFKILNNKSINQTIGLDYNRLSPAHGTATDIIYKNSSDNSSFIQCMLN